jgi:hypothetical protein
MTSNMLVFKLSWDSEKPASSYFTLRERKNFTVAIYIEKGG